MINLKEKSFDEKIFIQLIMKVSMSISSILRDIEDIHNVFTFKKIKQEAVGITDFDNINYLVDNILKEKENLKKTLKELEAIEIAYFKDKQLVNIFNNKASKVRYNKNKTKRLFSFLKELLNGNKFKVENLHLTKIEFNDTKETIIEAEDYILELAESYKELTKIQRTGD